ncbi:hypothetical protein A2766_04050 [Candidatus Kaiserbacteria bacterium RIFCSPHIGHO2_01_FULL_58_22]|nr:MAG: hypothetical protein A2766_04050 [Candidatus Kaiserbacteria bacterium RIFCSPHIGHO2_01_FULL_58_22]
MAGREFSHRVKAAQSGLPWLFSRESRVLSRGPEVRLLPIETHFALLKRFERISVRIDLHGVSLDVKMM